MQTITDPKLAAEAVRHGTPFRGPRDIVLGALGWPEPFTGEILHPFDQYGDMDPYIHTLATSGSDALVFRRFELPLALTSDDGDDVLHVGPISWDEASSRFPEIPRYVPVHSYSDDTGSGALTGYVDLDGCTFHRVAVEIGQDRALTVRRAVADLLGQGEAFRRYEELLARREEETARLQSLQSAEIQAALETIYARYRPILDETQQHFEDRFAQLENETDLRFPRPSPPVPTA